MDGDFYLLIFFVVDKVFKVFHVLEQKSFVDFELFLGDSLFVVNNDSDLIRW